MDQNISNALPSDLTRPQAGLNDLSDPVNVPGLDAIIRSERGSLIGGPSFYEGAVTPDALFIYLSTRLQSLDTQITGVFEKQQASEEVRSALRQIQAELAKLNSNESDPDAPISSEAQGTYDDIDAQLSTIATFDKKLETRLRQELLDSETGILHGEHAGPGSISYTTIQLNASKKCVENTLKDLEATAQLDMIQLQSLMSARQTAIQLATNLTASLGDSLKAIVANFGR